MISANQNPNKPNSDRPEKIKLLLNAMSSLLNAGDEGAALLDYITKLEESRNNMRILLDVHKRDLEIQANHANGNCYTLPDRGICEIHLKINEIEHVSTLSEEENVLEIARQDTINSMSEIFDMLWGLIYPGKTDWEYPGQVFNHVHAEILTLRKLKDNAALLLEGYAELGEMLIQELGINLKMQNAINRIKTWQIESKRFDNET